jgi:hypothetical protein
VAMSHEGFSKQVGELSHFEAWWCYHFCHHVCIYIYTFHCIASHRITWHDIAYIHYTFWMWWLCHYIHWHMYTYMATI